jgi:hypothetical protein
MRERDYPQIGELWTLSDNSKVFTVLDKQPDPEYKGWWILTILVDGNVETAHLSNNFSELDGIWWKVA